MTKTQPLTKQQFLASVAKATKGTPNELHVRGDQYRIAPKGADTEGGRVHA